MSGKRHRAVTPTPSRGRGGGRGGGRGNGSSGGRSGGRQGGRGGTGNEFVGRSRQRDGRLFTPPNGSASAAAASSSSRSRGSTSIGNPPMPAEQPDVDPLCLQAQMVLLINKNNSKDNADSFDAAHAKSLFDEVMAAKDDIIPILPPDRVASVSQAFDARLTQPTERVGKKHHVKKMVAIWMVLRDIPGIVNTSRRQTRQMSFDTYVGTMLKFERLATAVVNGNMQSLRQYKSDTMPPGERERKWKENSTPLSVIFFGSEHPQCPCGHHYTDGPPSNATVDDEWEEEKQEYFRLWREWKLWKAQQGPRPVDRDGKLLEKPPTAPKAKNKYIRCHCDQLFEDPRNGTKCPIGCKVNGLQMPIGRCPICSCTCKGYFPWNKYRNIMTAISLPSYESSTANDGQEAAASLLRESLSVNRVQQRTSINFYNTQRRNGTLSQHADTSSQVAREGSLAQALSIVGSQPSGPAVRHLRAQVDSVQHQSDPLMTQFGSIHDIGSRRSAAGDRARNNVLMMNPAQPDVMDLTDSPVQGDLAFGNGADLDFLEEHELLSIGASESMLAASGAASTSAAPNATLGVPPAATGAASAATTTANLPSLPPPTVPPPPRPSLSVPPPPPPAHGTPDYVNRQIAYANKVRKENRENGGEKQERARCVQIQKRLKRPDDVLRRDVLDTSLDKSTPERHQELMDMLSDEENE